MFTSTMAPGQPRTPAPPAPPRPVEVAAPEVSAGTAQWHVLHTRARQEKSLARTLAAADVEHFLPLVPRTSYCGHRKRTVETPLFASYLFLHGTTEDAWFAVGTRRVASVIPVGDQRDFVHQIEQIRLALSNGAELLTERWLDVGRHVRVTAGPFRGIEGMIEEHAKADRLVLRVSALGQATSLEIDSGLLEPVD